MTYRIVPRTEVGLPALVKGSTGALRPPLRNEPYITAHYTGNNVDYTGKATGAVVRQIQQVFSTTKPFEYNYCIGQDEDDEIVEFAGKFQAAHSAGENADSFGVLFLLGVGEPITDLMVDKWRWLRDVLIYDGSLVPNVDQRQHKQMPGAATACPGLSIVSRWSEMLKPWHPVTTPPIAPEEDDMKALTLWRHPNYKEVFLIGGGPAINVSPGLFAHYRGLGVPYFEDEAHDGLLASCVKQSGIARLTPA